jgi:putative nucleotidyltransferase with HDIG domain
MFKDTFNKLYGNLLLIDNNSIYIDKIFADPKLIEIFPLLTKSTLSEGLKLLAKEKGKIRIIFISTILISKASVEKIKSIKESSPDIQFVLIKHGKEILADYLKDNPIFNRILLKPKGYVELTEVFKELFVQKLDWEKVEASPEAKDVEITKEETEFISTHINEYIFTAKSLFNVFIKIGPKKYIKVVNAGDPVLIDTVESYASKGIQELFIPVLEHDKYIRFTQNLSAKGLSTGGAPKKKIENLLNFGSSVSQSLIQTGVSVKKLDLANELLNQSVSLIKNQGLRNSKISKMFDLIEYKDHLSFVSFLSCLVANEVGFETSKTIKLVGLSALLHDIGLYDLDPKLENEDVCRVNNPDMFLKHPSHGAELLRKAGGIDETVCLVVEQHHLRRKGTPDTRSVNVNLLTEIIAVADDLHNHLMIDGFTPQKFEQFVMTDLEQFSPTIEKAVIKLFQAG